MRERIPEIVLISAETTKSTELENRQATEKLKDIFRQKGVKFLQANGCYNGVKEVSFLCWLNYNKNQDIEFYAKLAHEFSQKNYCLSG